MPQQIELSGNRSIQNMYATDGRKLKTSVKEGEELMDGTKYYNANFVFDKQKEMEYILFDEGRIVNDNGNFMYEYHLKDHLGSVRVAFVPTTSGTEIVQENAYYPFGGTIDDFSYNASENRYKHTGMEAINDFGLNMLDNNARWRGNPFAPGFLSIDPLAEKYYNSSPYAYCANNPIRFIDPTGMEAELTDYRNQKGELLYKTDDGLKDIIIVKDNEIPKLEEKLNEANKNGTINNPETNTKEMHPLGTEIMKYKDKHQTNNHNIDAGYVVGYEKIYNEKSTTGWDIFYFFLSFGGQEGAQLRTGNESGKDDGENDRTRGYINALNPYSDLKNNLPLLTIPTKVKK